MNFPYGAALALGLLTAAPAGALPLLSEVFYDASGADDGQSFVELAGTPGASLDGLVIEGVNGSNGSVTHSLVLTGTFGGDGLFVVADQMSDGTTLVAGADLLLNFDFQNGPDSVVLRNGGGVVDALAYGVFGAGEVSAGEGTPAPDVPAGDSLARLFANVDTDDNASDFVGGAPTPGVATFAVPEPTGATLLGLGLLGLARAGRRR
ncbi:MAG: hypothetical protein ABFS41_08235 [Myxococcota bacterium]